MAMDGGVGSDEVEGSFWVSHDFERGKSGARESSWDSSPPPPPLVLLLLAPVSR